MPTENEKRVLVGLVGIPVIFTGVYLGGLYFLVIILVISLIGQHEFYTISMKKGANPNKILGYIGTLAVVGSFYQGDLHQVTAIISIYLLLSIFFEVFRNKDQPIYNVATGIVGLLYPGLFLSTLLIIRSLPYESLEMLNLEGAELIILIFIGVWGCDTAAYYFGRAFGKHKFFERISPKKTWEGSIAGLFSSVILVISLSYLGFAADVLRIQDAVVIGLLTGSVGQLGDLFESLMKRDAGVKDSGSLLPGHGGMLDRFDALIFSSPVVTIYLLWVLY